MKNLIISMLMILSIFMFIGCENNNPVSVPSLKYKVLPFSENEDRSQLPGGNAKVKFVTYSLITFKDSTIAEFQLSPANSVNFDSFLLREIEFEGGRTGFGLLGHYDIETVPTVYLGFQNDDKSERNSGVPNRSICFEMTDIFGVWSRIESFKGKIYGFYHSDLADHDFSVKVSVKLKEVTQEIITVNKNIKDLFSYNLLKITRKDLPDKLPETQIKIEIMKEAGDGNDQRLYGIIDWRYHYNSAKKRYFIYDVYDAISKYYPEKISDDFEMYFFVY